MFNQTLDDILGIYDKAKEKTVQLLKPMQAPIYDLLKKMGKKKVQAKPQWIEDELSPQYAKDDTQFNKQDLDDILGVKKQPQPQQPPGTTSWAASASASYLGNTLNLNQMSALTAASGACQIGRGQAQSQSGSCPLCGQNMSQIHKTPIQSKKPKLTLDEILDEEI